MTNFNKLTLASILGIMMPGASQALPTRMQGFDLSRHSYNTVRSESRIGFGGQRTARINRINAMLVGESTEQYTPDVSFNAEGTIGDLDGPDNTLWFYTSEMVYKTIHHEYYDEQILLEYQFDIFNEKAEHVGTVRDKMRYEENEVRAVSCSLVPMLSRHFFNEDEMYEVMVGLGINRNRELPDGSTEWMSNSYRNMVYSIGGEKETLEVETPDGTTVTKEFDKPVYRVDGSLGDVLDASKGGKEDIYLTFYDESLPEYSDNDIIGGEEGPEVSDEFWNKLTAAHISMKVCGKVNADGKMPELMKFDIPILSMPGDQENTPFMISFRNGDDAYYMVQYYKDIFFNRYDSPTDDMSMREHNSLIVDLYKVNDGKVEKQSSTEIPFVKDSKDRLLFSFHSVGDFRYAEDMNFDKDGKITFFVTKNNYFADEHNEYSYYHYGNDGKKLNDIFQNAQSNMPMTNIDGLEPQQMFVTYGNGEYIFHFVDLLSGEERTRFSCYLEIDEDSDPDMMTSNIDRTKVGDTYQYAVEMRTPSVDENDNSILRICWLDAEGKFLRMDEVNMGQYVVYAQCYIDGYSLQPGLYLKDAHNEYMMLIKRGVDATTTREDLLIAQAMNPDAPEGRDVLHLTPDERGVLSTINPYTMLENPMLHVYYYNQAAGTMSMDIYNLPFDAAAVKEILSDRGEDLLAFDGESVYAENCEISICNLDGMLICKGRGSVNVSDLTSGIYIAVANGEVRKFVVK